MFARLSITTAVHRGALLLPLEAVHMGSPSTVMAIGEGKRVQRLPVRLGLANGTMVEILSGLDEGRLVASGTTANLADGDIVVPQVERLTARAKSE
jgi:multidrug efflux pump subunit AcrA (membrane-fusion protein)